MQCYSRIVIFDDPALSRQRKGHGFDPRYIDEAKIVRIVFICEKVAEVKVAVVKIGRMEFGGEVGGGIEEALNGRPPCTSFSASA